MKYINPTPNQIKTTLTNNRPKDLLFTKSFLSSGNRFTIHKYKNAPVVKANNSTL